jgi:serine/threonine protein kinase
MDPAATLKLFQTELYKANLGDRTMYLLEDSNGEFYYGRTKKTAEQLVAMTSESLKTEIERESLKERNNVDCTNLFATFDPDEMTVFKGDVKDPEVFLKRQRFLADVQGLKLHPEVFRDYAEREIEVGECLIQHPHVNVCKYLGAVVAPSPLHGNRITDIVYKRYTCDLSQFVKKGLLKYSSQFNLISDSLKAGLDHLHSLGFVHCDVRPANVFLTLDASDLSAAKSDSKILEVVIGDFDAVSIVGQPIEGKIAPDEWRPHEDELDIYLGDEAVVELDEICLRITTTWLRKYLDACPNERVSGNSPKL